jgi:hypothetical protein
MKPSVAQESGDAHRVVDERFVGTWLKEVSDATAQQKITLVLRRDGTYRKTLHAVIQGVSYGGTHEGTWSINGTIVQLSGDGKWPPYSHDLSEFRQIERGSKSN